MDTIFRKAQNEPTYCAFYCKLVQDIIKIDLESKGFRPTLKNLKESNFRSLLLSKCKTLFEQMYSQKSFAEMKAEAEKKGTTYTEEDFKE